MTNGFLLSAQRRATKGVAVGGNYTWSHCIGDLSGSQDGGGGTPGAAYLDPNNRHFDRGDCAGSRRQIFNTTVVAETPQFGNLNFRLLASGWRLSGIYRRSSGILLTLASGVDRLLNGVQNQRPQQISANPYGNKSLTNYLNPGAFTLPAVGSLGNMGPSSLVGHTTWQFDAALSRVFRLHEIQSLEARAEAYNVTNSLRPGNPNTGLNQGTFGQITTALDPGILQFALKYIF